MKLSDFMYDLPEERIAQTPVEPRDHSRLMVLNREKHTIEHRHFYDIIDYLNPGDALVINETRVIPARLIGERPSGGACEILLLRQLAPKRWEALDVLEIDELGLDNTDITMLKTMIERFDGGPVGLDTLAATTGEDAATIEDVYEPYLLQLGFIMRTPRGRVCTRAAYEHLGMQMPQNTENKQIRMDV